MNEHNPLELLNLEETVEDQSSSFSPQTFSEYLGQKTLKEKLSMFVKACKQRNEALDHVLLFGPPGLGKTTLAKVIAQERGVGIKITSAPIIERTGDLVAILTNMKKHEVLFIDEIHRLPSNVEEILYSAMENFCVDMIVGQGAGAKSIRLPLQPFTLIGATTKTGSISGPLQTRFGIVERIDFYEPEDLALITQQSATYYGVKIDEEGSLAVGKRARGTPRIVKRLLRRVRDFAQVHDHKVINVDIVDKALTFLGIDHDGLNVLDRKVLMHIVKDFNGGPVGLDTIAAMTGEDRETLEDVCEPFLMRLGLLQKTPRGRQIPLKKIVYIRQRFLGESCEEQSDLF